MATVTILSTAKRTGIFTPASIDIQSTVRKARLYFESTEFTSNDLQIAVRLDESLDGGQSWREMGHYAGRGGDIDRFGNPALPGTTLEFTDGQPRKIRLTVTVFGQFRVGLKADIA